MIYRYVEYIYLCVDISLFRIAGRLKTVIGLYVTNALYCLWYPLRCTVITLITFLKGKKLTASNIS